MNIPQIEYKATYERITESHRSEIRLDLVANEIQITVYSCPISHIDALIEKLQALKTQVAPPAPLSPEQQIAAIKAEYSNLELGQFDLYEEREKRIQAVYEAQFPRRVPTSPKPTPIIQMEVVKEFSTLIEVEDDEPELPSYDPDLAERQHLNSLDYGNDENTVLPLDDEPEIMTTVLGQKPDPTGWYRNALQKAASVPAPVKYENVHAPVPPMPTPRKGKAIINIIGVTTKGYTRYGKKYPGTINMKHNADIAKQQWIRIYGIESDRTKYDRGSGIATHYTPAFDLTFKMGDTCVYGSYNLVYTGKIVGIGAKTVTIEKSGYSQNTVLDIATFIHRNWDYDAKAIFERNSNWSD